MQNQTIALLSFLIIVIRLLQVHAVKSTVTAVVPLLIEENILEGLIRTVLVLWFDVSQGMDEEIDEESDLRNSCLKFCRFTLWAIRTLQIDGLSFFVIDLLPHCTSLTFSAAVLNRAGVWKVEGMRGWPMSTSPWIFQPQRAEDYRGQGLPGDRGLNGLRR